MAVNKLHTSSDKILAPKRMRFGSVETMIVIVIVVIIMAVCGTLLLRVVDNAKLSLYNAYAHSLYLAVNVTLSTETFKDAELTDFTVKYKTLHSIDELLVGKNPIEKSMSSKLVLSPQERQNIINAGLSSSQTNVSSSSDLPLRGFFRINIDENSDITVFTYEKATDTKFGIYPK